MGSSSPSVGMAVPSSPFTLTMAKSVYLKNPRMARFPTTESTSTTFAPFSFPLARHLPIPSPLQ